MQLYRQISRVIRKDLRPVLTVFYAAVVGSTIRIPVHVRFAVVINRILGAVLQDCAWFAAHDEA